MSVSPPVSRRLTRRTPYLVRSGGTWLFQIRIPKALDPNGKMAPLRICLGALSAREARKRADIMAAVSRIAFETLRIRRLSNEEDKQQPEIEPMFPGDDPALVLSEIKGYLKAHIPIINSDHIQPSAEQQKLMNALKGIVQVNREIDRGVDGNPIVAENADLLRNRHIQILSAPAGTDPNSTPVPTQARSERVSLTSPDPAPRLQPQKMTVGSLGQAMAPGDAISAVDRDRRYVPRQQSTKPLFSVVSEEYLQARAGRSGEDDPDVGTARMRRDIFIDLIGDHPVDTYNGSDLQAFVNLLKFLPANVTKRKDATNLTPGS